MEMMPIYCCSSSTTGTAQGVADVGEQIAERRLRLHRQRASISAASIPAGAERGFQRIDRDNPDKAITALNDITIFPVFIL